MYMYILTHTWLLTQALTHPHSHTHTFSRAIRTYAHTLLINCTAHCMSVSYTRAVWVEYVRSTTICTHTQSHLYTYTIKLCRSLRSSWFHCELALKRNQKKEKTKSKRLQMAHFVCKTKTTITFSCTYIHNTMYIHNVRYLFYSQFTISI